MVRRSSRIAKIQSDSESDEPAPVRRAAARGKATPSQKKATPSKKKSTPSKKKATPKKKKAAAKSGRAGKKTSKSKAQTGKSPRDESAARGAWVLNKPEFRSTAKLKKKSLLSPIPSFEEVGGSDEGSSGDSGVEEERVAAANGGPTTREADEAQSSDDDVFTFKEFDEKQGEETASVPSENSAEKKARRMGLLFGRTSSSVATERNGLVALAKKNGLNASFSSGVAPAASARAGHGTVGLTDRLMRKSNLYSSNASEASSSSAPKRGFHDFVTPKMTPEIQRDLEILKMRSFIDPKRFYKKSDSKRKLPTEFQMGTIIEGAAEFKSSRLTKKQRHGTMSEELYHDKRARKYTRRVFNDVQAAKRLKKKTKQNNRRW